MYDEAVEANTTNDAELASCILRKVNGFRFDLDLEADVSYPFILSTQ